jgi:hypothetical protein
MKFLAIRERKLSHKEASRSSVVGENGFQLSLAALRKMDRAEVCVADD